MNDYIEVRALLRREETLSEFLDWLRSEDRLTEAAALLGGGAWAARAAMVQQAVSEGCDPLELLEEVSALRDLLHLEYADDLGSPEAECFAAIHPDDPRADDARLCAEALDKGLATLKEHEALIANFGDKEAA